MKRALLMRLIYTGTFILCTLLLSQMLPQSLQESFAVFDGDVSNGISETPLAVGFLILLLLLLLFFSQRSVTIKVKERGAKGNS